MRREILDILLCPFCGCPLTAQSALDAGNAILHCECSTYPVVAGIPVLQQDYKADEATEYLAAGDAIAALCVMLELDDAAPLREVTNYRAGIALLGTPDEGPYFINRFADPTFLVSAAVTRGVSSYLPKTRALDICGGSGHLTRVLCQTGFAEVFLAETDYWKLWLAQRFIAPSATMICCDANNPLPFAPDSFALAICSDAFHYVWSKRLLAAEMLRLVGDSGAAVVTHAHNKLCHNFSAGEPLTPAGYQNLFAPKPARLYRDSEFLAAAVAGREPDFSVSESAEVLAGEAVLTLIASSRAEVFSACEPTANGHVEGVLGLNPLYAATRDGEWLNLRLRFPSAGYAKEYAACKLYLAEELTVSMADIERGAPELVARRVLLDLPEGFGFAQP